MSKVISGLWVTFNNLNTLYKDGGFAVDDGGFAVVRKIGKNERGQKK